MKKKPETAKYSDQYNDPRWQKLRLEIMNRDGFSCASCGSGKRTLHVHHISYEKGKRVWEYEACHLITLCDSCHFRIHEVCEYAVRHISLMFTRGCDNEYDTSDLENVIYAITTGEDAPEFRDGVAILRSEYSSNERETLEAIEGE